MNTGKKSSIGTFKCCSDGKDLTCYYCTACESIQHRSCVERRKSTIYIGGFRIFCGKKCEDMAKEKESELESDLISGEKIRRVIQNQQLELEQKQEAFTCSKDCKKRYDSNIDESRRLTIEHQKLKKNIAAKSNEIKDLKLENEKEVSELNKEIIRLEDEIRGKDRHIERERRRTLDLTDLVLVEEETLMSELNLLKETLKNRDQKIILLLQQNETLQREADVLKNEKLEHKKQQTGSDAERKKLSSQIAVLKTENATYLYDLKDTRIKLQKLLEEKATLRDTVLRDLEIDKQNKPEEHQRPLAVINVCSKETQTPIIVYAEAEAQANLLALSLEQDGEESTVSLNTDLTNISRGSGEKDLQEFSLVQSLAQELDELAQSSIDTQTTPKPSETSYRSATVQTKLTCLGSKRAVTPEVQLSDSPNKCCQLPISLGVRRLLIIGSSFSVKNLPRLIKYHRKQMHIAGGDINCQFFVEPLTLESMASKGYSLSRTFGMEDHVILCMDTRSAEERNVLTCQAIKDIMDQYGNTNVIIVGASQNMTPHNQKQSVYEYNLLIKKHLHSLEAGRAYISLDRFTPENPNLPKQQSHYIAKDNLATYLCREYLNPSRSMPKTNMALEERLGKLLGRKQDNWHPKIATFPKGYPLPSDALRGLSLPVVNLDSPVPTTNIQQNFWKRYPGLVELR